MELQTAREIIDTLSRGIHPVSGEPMPADSPYNAPAVIRALFTVSHALDAGPPGKPRRQRELPARTGQPWRPEDDAELRAGAEAGTPPADLAAALGRTRRAVEMRLMQMGVVLPQRGDAALDPRPPH